MDRTYRSATIAHGRSNPKVTYRPAILIFLYVKTRTDTVDVYLCPSHFLDDLGVSSTMATKLPSWDQELSRVKPYPCPRNREKHGTLSFFGTRKAIPSGTDSAGPRSPFCGSMHSERAARFGGLHCLIDHFWTLGHGCGLVGQSPWRNRRGLRAGF